MHAAWQDAALYGCSRVYQSIFTVLPVGIHTEGIPSQQAKTLQLDAAWLHLQGFCSYCNFPATFRPLRHENNGL